ncbi:hypothetical protein DERP_014077 [Dermatophagoides pteronyssinus]|uniref:Uncharacterized protein n=3 Tax=Dermatophagoides pteronyssinus TaxID=6956 RepID=A0ABQ8J6A4_DERPT|nr:transmembrane protein 208-like [Dermatophagoides pteronyssinus]KAH9418115.1 hypothetical protein DERP_014077 [Dermatophagoides pteronyssinus]
MAGPTKGGKQATKGQKQIYLENNETIKHYTYMSSISTLIYLIVMLIYWSDLLFTFKYISGFIFCLFIHGFSLSMMKYMAKPVFNSTGSLVDGGTDLNMEKGFAEHFKDLIIINSLIQVLSLFSNYFWYCWCFVPIYAFYSLWVNILGPWFFAPPPAEEQVDEKKQRKMERKMRRMAN